MNDLTLVIGNKNYSSWSLRPWLLLKQFKVRFKEVRIPLYEARTSALMAQYSPSGKVPVLDMGGLTVCDSLAIAETVNERFLDGQGWPGNPNLRALGRAAVAEMHSGFFALRNAMPMNCRRRVSGFKPDAATQKDIDRVCELLGDLLQRSEGPFLLGKFSIADAFYAPVASRFTTYGIAVPQEISQWMGELNRLKAMQEWLSAAQEEAETIAESEIADA
ncbi:glutathione S-transferase family protein [Saccharospirillum mangrovi]|uniref:glutathione S-transferase family protein n=1 Tax=Saccharospirillum mangrovi TaxID=2161747 RepID=UPI001E424BAB|nr:glutathione S-transferase family protein [Saccharospirillum mangrovi]